jgi:hypothetical protein
MLLNPVKNSVQVRPDKRSQMQQSMGKIKNRDFGARRRDFQAGKRIHQHPGRKQVDSIDPCRSMEIDPEINC